MTDATPETWKPVPGYEGLYEVSDHGSIWSSPRPRTKGGILRLFPDRHDYRWVTLTKNGEQERRAVHQLVMLAFVGPPEPGQEVRHLDGSPANNRWAPGDTEEEVRAAGGNLFYGTHSENMLDKTAHGTSNTANVTHCPSDHEYTPENTLVNKAGSRVCITCKRERGLEWYRANATRKDPAMICPGCEQPFERPLGQGARKYCSDECARKVRAAKRVARKAS